MKKYYDPLDDYTDHSPSPFLEMTKYIMARLFVVACVALAIAVCAHLEML